MSDLMGPASPLASLSSVFAGLNATAEMWVAVRSKSGSPASGIP